MTTDHLIPAAAAVIDQSASARVDWLRRSCWLPYPRAEALLQKLEMLLSEPRRPRMPNLLIYGPTNNGKTTILRRFLKAHPVNQSPTETSDHVPVLYAHLPPVPDERAFYDELLSNFATPILRSDRTIDKRRQVVNLMRHTRVRILVLDEVQDILAGDSKRHLAILQVLKWLGNVLEIPIVAAGIESAYNAISLEAQLSNRFAQFELPRWKCDDNFEDLLDNFESVLPLRQRSGLASEKLKRMCFDLSEGILGELGELLRSAAREALLRRQEKISRTTLLELEWVKPSLRHKRK